MRVIWFSKAIDVSLAMTLMLAIAGYGPAVFGQSPAASADRYPNRTIQMIVPWAPSGPTDVYARLIASYLQTAWERPVIVESRPGASGTIGAAFVARATPDGYILLFNSVTNVIAPLLQKTPAYHPVDDFEPVAMFARNPMLIVTSAPVPAKSLQEFINYARERPGRLNFGSPGVGSIGHMVMELFRNRAQIDMVHIPYKGGAPTFAALLANEVQLSTGEIPFARQQMKAGKVRVLAQLEPTRSPLLPEVPTVTEAGLPGIDVSFWFGLFAPEGTPASIVARLNQEVNRAKAFPALAEKIAAFGAELVTSTPEAFRARILQDMGTYGTLIKQNRISAE